MIPLYALGVSFLLFQALGLLGIPYFGDWQSSLRAAVAVMLLVAASAHWGKRRRDLAAMVPPVFPKPERIVSVTGVLELAGVAGLLIPALSEAAAVGLALLLAAMFPANVYAARHSLTVGGRPVPRIAARAAMQVLFIAAVLIAGFG